MKTHNHYALAFIAFFIWGMTFPFAKMVIPPLSSYSFVFLRSLMGFVFLFFLLILKKEITSWWQSLKARFWPIFLFSLGPFVISYVIQFYAIQFTTAINQSIIAQTIVVWVVIINFLVFKQKPKLKFVVGIIVGIFGVVLIITKPNFAISEENLKGDLLSVVAFISWASYTAFSKPMVQKTKPIYLTTSVLMFGALILAGIATFTGLFQQTSQLDTVQWIVILYLGFVCTGVTYLFHLIGLSGSDVKSEYVAYFALIMPIVSTTFSVLFLDEILSWRIGLGGVFVLLSVIIIQFKKKTEKSPENAQE
jgi:drug/metabolite transporter (DMT)-like permease